MLLGAPGSGKGTTAKRLCEEYGIPHISTGDMLRKEIESSSSLGQNISQVIADGNLIEDDLMLSLLDKRINEDDCRKGFILDGLPRTIEQALKFNAKNEKIIKYLKVLKLDISTESLKKRVVGRFSCENCGEIYNKYSKLPIKKEVCDICNHKKFITRPDDNEYTFNERMSIYNKQIGPIIDLYANIGILYNINVEVFLDDLLLEVKNIVNLM